MTIERCINGSGRLPITANATGAKVEEFHNCLVDVPRDLAVATMASVEHGAQYPIGEQVKIIAFI